MSDDLNNLEYWRKRALAAEEKLRLCDPPKPKMPRGCQIMLMVILCFAWAGVAYSTHLFFTHARQVHQEQSR